MVWCYVQLNQIYLEWFVQCVSKLILDICFDFGSLFLLSDLEYQSFIFGIATGSMHPKSL